MRHRAPKRSENETPFRTSPSAVARYFFHDCERFFRFSASSSDQRKRENVPEMEFNQSPLMKAIFESGYLLLRMRPSLVLHLKAWKIYGLR